jgi:carboxylesterase
MTEESSPPPGEPKAAPFFERRGRLGVLLLHGYSGSPDELRPMGQALAAAGYSVCGPRLAGHGGTPADLFGVTWRDWLASAEQGLAELRAHCDAVAVCGFSAGALLALHMAAQKPLAGLILLAPALRIRGGALLRLTGLLRHVMPWYYPLARADFANPAVRAAVLDRAPHADLDDPAVVAAIRREAKVPVGSLFELSELQRVAQRSLPHVTTPTLIMQGRLDQTVDPRSAALVASGIAARDRRVVWFEHSGHQLPLEREREAIWSTALEWLDARAAGAGR